MKKWRIASARYNKKVNLVAEKTICSFDNYADAENYLVEHCTEKICLWCFGGNYGNIAETEKYRAEYKKITD